MLETICGADCGECPFREACGGCVRTGGRPFGEACIVAECCKEKNQERCAACGGACALRKQLLEEMSALDIPDLPEITRLYSLRGAFVNLEYPLPDGRRIKLLEDDKVYLGTQVPKQGSGRFYGLVADEEHLLVCEYSGQGDSPEIVLYRRRKGLR
ncbi:MAG: DUF3795 domain-containing protein [Oscillospiraceae bacterium]|nr:DUF3795 domain-containing protein [Oscillospiraceae bacterium]